jgi:hypothetical protein
MKKFLLFAFALLSLSGCIQEEEKKLNATLYKFEFRNDEFIRIENKDDFGWRNVSALLNGIYSCRIPDLDPSDRWVLDVKSCRDKKNQSINETVRRIEIFSGEGKAIFYFQS